jgi:hypothetical protein
LLGSEQKVYHSDRYVSLTRLDCRCPWFGQ